MRNMRKANDRNTKPVVGYASGVFDLFHVGHLNLLRRAKGLCDRLVVGVTADDLVGYKNAEAVIPFAERLAIVEAVRYVDAAVPQDDLDKFAMWKRLKFDVLFIGDDWYETERYKDFEARLAAVGVKVVYLPYTEGVSTTDIKGRIFSKLVRDRSRGDLGSDPSPS